MNLSLYEKIWVRENPYYGLNYQAFACYAFLDWVVEHESERKKFQRRSYLWRTNTFQKYIIQRYKLYVEKLVLKNL